MKHCFNVNLPIHPLKEGIDLMKYMTRLNLNSWDRVMFPISDVNPELISVIKSLNLRILLAEYFYTPPGVFSPIHIDLEGGDYIKINYIFGGKDSTMQWYTIKDNASKVENTTFTVYDLSQVDLAYSTKIEVPTIVQVGTPHNIQNYDEPRHCVSVVLQDKNNKRLTMQTAIDVFKEYIY